MKRNRLVFLSSFVLVASGALVFACSSGDDTTDAGGKDSGGSDAKADSTTKDATADVTAKDSTTNDTGTDANPNDSSTDGGADTSTDSGPSDAGGGLTFMVLRAGGTADAGTDAALSTTSTDVFVEERQVSDGALVRTIALPVAVNGANQPLTVSGSSTSEGALTTSTDGHYVLLTGFAIAPGTAAVNKSSIFNGGPLRVVARIDHAGNVDTSTQLAAYDLNDIRCAATDDAGAFWTAGTSAPDAAALGGIQYALQGSTGTATNITSVPNNIRTVGAFGGQLYISSASTPFNGISTVGTGEPTTTGQTSTLLAGFAGDAGSPYAFSLLDLDGSVSGLDTLYVADDSLQTKGGGIQKWVSNGTTWAKIATFTYGTTGGFRGVMAVVSAGQVIVVGTTTESDGNSVVKFIDDGVNTTPTGTLLSTTAANTVYRGISLAPQ